MQVIAFCIWEVRGVAHISEMNKIPYLKSSPVQPHRASLLCTGLINGINGIFCCLHLDKFFVSFLPPPLQPPPPPFAIQSGSVNVIGAVTGDSAVYLKLHSSNFAIHIFMEKT